MIRITIKQCRRTQEIIKRRSNPRLIRIPFRQNLEGKSRRLVRRFGRRDQSGLGDRFRQNFRTAFRITAINTCTRKFALRVQLYNLKQREGKSIAGYVGRAEELAARLPEDDIDAGMATLKGMRDVDKRDWISFECNKDVDYTFVTVRRLVMAAYNEVEKTNFADWNI